MIDGGFIRQTVNLSEHFVNSSTDAHTQAI